MFFSVENFTFIGSVRHKFPLSLPIMVSLTAFETVVFYQYTVNSTREGSNITISLSYWEQENLINVAERINEFLFIFM